MEGSCLIFVIVNSAVINIPIQVSWFPSECSHWRPIPNCFPHEGTKWYFHQQCVLHLLHIPTHILYYDTFLIKTKILWFPMQIWIFLITKEIKYIITNIGHLCFCCESLFKALFIFILGYLYFSNWFLGVLYIFGIIIICFTVSLNKQMFFIFMYTDFYVHKNISIVSSWLANLWSFPAGSLLEVIKIMIYFC